MKKTNKKIHQNLLKVRIISLYYNPDGYTAECSETTVPNNSFRLKNTHIIF